MRILKEFECTKCGTIFEDLVGDDLVRDPCPQCGSFNAVEIMLTAPSVRTDNNSASYLDGTKHKGNAELKESYTLESKSYELPLEKRGAIDKEIKRLRTVK